MTFLAFSCNLPVFRLIRSKGVFNCEMGFNCLAEKQHSRGPQHIKWHKLWKNHRGIDRGRSKVTRPLCNGQQMTIESPASGTKAVRLRRWRRRSGGNGNGNGNGNSQAVQGQHKGWGVQAAGQSHNEVISAGQWASVFNCQWMPHHLLTFCGYLGNSSIEIDPSPLHAVRKRWPPPPRWEVPENASAAQMPILMANATMGLI